MRRVLALLAGGLAAACAVGPSYHRPDLGVPERWRPPSATADSLRPFYDSLRSSGESTLPQPTVSLDSVANLDWFELLRDPELRKLVETALQQNRDVRVALASIDEFRAQYGATRGALFPRLDLNGAGGTEKIVIGSLGAAKFDVVTATANLRWEVDFWGRIRRATEAARADLLSREESRRAVILSLVSDVATAYLELRELDLDLEISKRTLASNEETLRLARRRFDQGLISELDVRQFESEVANPAARVADFERQIAQKENQLSVLVGRYPGAIPRGPGLTETLAPLTIPAGLPASLIDRRPDVRQSEQQFHAALARIGVAKGALMPTFTLTGQYGTQSQDFSNLFKNSTEIYQLLGGVSIPIFTGGQVGKQVDVARARTEQARYSYEQTVLQALQEVNDALVGVRASRDVAAAQERQTEALRSAYRLADRRYQNGISSYLEVLDSQRNLFTAELALAQAQRQQLAAAVQLYKALGGGWPVAMSDSVRR
ncbi:MAG TPA: efflux transporter outer membrane subunit [Gemmatimonadales bacterium]